VNDLRKEAPRRRPGALAVWSFFNACVVDIHRSVSWIFGFDKVAITKIVANFFHDFDCFGRFVHAIEATNDRLSVKRIVFGIQLRSRALDVPALWQKHPIDRLVIDVDAPASKFVS
jgi:hypothetical protein